MPLVCLAKPSLLAPILGVNSPSCLSYGELPISPLALCRIPRRLSVAPELTEEQFDELVGEMRDAREEADAEGSA